MMSRKEDIKELITQLDRRLKKLKQQAAIAGHSVDSKLLLAIKDIETVIEGLQTARQALEGWENVVTCQEIINEWKDLHDLLQELHKSFLPFHNKVNQLSHLSIAIVDRQLNTKKYNLKNIRALFTTGFGASELRNHCYYEDDFRPVYEKLTRDMDKDRVVTTLIEYAERKELMEELLIIAKKNNPNKYKRYQPYINDTNGKSQSSDVKSLKELWRPCRQGIRILKEFAQRVKYICLNKSYCEKNGKLSGPDWIVDIVDLQQRLEKLLEEKDCDITTLQDLTGEFYYTCYTHLYLVDKSLKSEAENLYNVASDIRAKLG